MLLNYYRVFLQHLSALLLLSVASSSSLQNVNEFKSE